MINNKCLLKAIEKATTINNSGFSYLELMRDRVVVPIGTIINNTINDNETIKQCGSLFSCLGYTPGGSFGFANSLCFVLNHNNGQLSANNTGAFGGGFSFLSSEMISFNGRLGNGGRIRFMNMAYKTSMCNNMQDIIISDNAFRTYNGLSFFSSLINSESNKVVCTNLASNGYKWVRPDGADASIFSYIDAENSTGLSWNSEKLPIEVNDIQKTFTNTSKSNKQKIIVRPKLVSYTINPAGTLNYGDAPKLQRSSMIDLPSKKYLPEFNTSSFSFDKVDFEYFLNMRNIFLCLINFNSLNRSFIFASTISPTSWWYKDKSYSYLNNDKYFFSPAQFSLLSNITDTKYAIFFNNNNNVTQCFNQYCSQYSLGNKNIDGTLTNFFKTTYWQNFCKKISINCTFEYDYDSIASFVREYLFSATNDPTFAKDIVISMYAILPSLKWDYPNGFTCNKTPNDAYATKQPEWVFTKYDG